MTKSGMEIFKAVQLCDEIWRYKDNNVNTKKNSFLYSVYSFSSFLPFFHPLYIFSLSLSLCLLTLSLSFLASLLYSSFQYLFIHSLFIITLFSFFLSLITSPEYIFLTSLLFFNIYLFIHSLLTFTLFLSLFFSFFPLPSFLLDSQQHY